MLSLPVEQASATSLDGAFNGVVPANTAAGNGDENNPNAAGWASTPAVDVVELS